MIRLVDDVLRKHFGFSAGLASTDVTLADPAVGTGTFILGVLRRIAANVEADEGAGAVAQATESAISRLIAGECVGVGCVAATWVAAAVVTGCGSAGVAGASVAGGLLATGATGATGTAAGSVRAALSAAIDAAET